MNLKRIKKQLEKYRGNIDSLWASKKRQVNNLKVLPNKRNDSVTFSALVKGTSTKRPRGAQFSTGIHETSVTFYGIDIANKKEKGMVPADVDGRVVYYKKPTSKDEVKLKCTCASFMFEYEHQNHLGNALVGRFRKYKRKTPPNKRPLAAKNPNPDGHDFVNPTTSGSPVGGFKGYCLHVHSLLSALNKSKLMSGK